MFDIFSRQFEFFIGHNRTGRHTIYGRILSVIILIISVSFFITMTIQLSNNELLPKIVEITGSEEEFNEIEFEKSPLSYFVVINSKMIENIDDYKQYFYLSFLYNSNLGHE